MVEVYKLAQDLRLNCVTEEMVTERLGEFDNLESVKRVALSLIEEMKPKMAFAGTRKEMLGVSLDLVSKTLDLEFLVSKIDSLHTGS